MVDATGTNSGLGETCVIGSVQPSREQMGDIEFGWPLLRQLAERRIGSAMAVRERDVIAVQATESTVSMIRRAGELCRRQTWVLLKTAGNAAGEDRPSVTVAVVETLAGAGGRCLGIDHIDFADKQAVLEAADRAKIAVVGIAGP